MEITSEMYLEEVPRHYWRSLTYDRYFGRGWAASSVVPLAYEAGAPITVTETLNSRTLRQTVRFIGDRASSLSMARSCRSTNRSVWSGARMTRCLPLQRSSGTVSR